MKFFATLYKVTFRYHALFPYLYYRYIVAPKIFSIARSLERPVTHGELSIHMLTCHRDILLALWSLASFYHVSSVIGTLTIHDDGTLTKNDRARIMKLFPHAHIEPVADFMRLHGSILDAYPTLKKFRETYKKFQSKKLIDVFALRKGRIVLFLDSDLLWFKDPVDIATAVQGGARDISYMMSNGIERVHVTFTDGSTTSDHVAECNSGVTLFHERNFSFDALASYVERCDYMGRKFTDQACFGSILKNVTILPRDRYFIKGQITDETIMRHYTGPSREKFFFYGVNRIYKDILKN